MEKFIVVTSESVSLPHPISESEEIVLSELLETAIGD